jgi:hypothetical protein
MTKFPMTAAGYSTSIQYVCFGPEADLLGVKYVASAPIYCDKDRSSRGLRGRIRKEGKCKLRITPRFGDPKLIALVMALPP